MPIAALCYGGSRRHLGCGRWWHGHLDTRSTPAPPRTSPGAVPNLVDHRHLTTQASLTVHIGPPVSFHCDWTPLATPPPLESCFCSGPARACIHCRGEAHRYYKGVRGGLGLGPKRLCTPGPSFTGRRVSFSGSCVAGAGAGPLRKWNCKSSHVASYSWCGCRHNAILNTPDAVADAVRTPVRKATSWHPWTWVGASQSASITPQASEPQHQLTWGVARMA